MQSATNHIDAFIAKVSDLAETKANLWKLRIAGRVADTTSSAFSRIITILLAGTALLFISVGAAWWIGEALGSLPSGFFIVGGLYALVALLLVLFGKHLVKTPFKNFIIDKMVEDHG